jgi:hypothetical protein
MAPGGERPLLTVDMDGVICRPILGQNVGISRVLLDPGEPPKPARVYPRWLGARLDYLRFNFRRPIDGAREAIADLGRVRRLVLLTGRRSVPHDWLRRHGFDGLFDDVVVNETLARSPHYKLEAVRRLGADEHVDDDARTVQLLADLTEVRLFLCDWPRNRGVPIDERIVRVQGIADLARRLLAERARLDGAGSAE